MSPDTVLLGHYRLPGTRLSTEGPVLLELLHLPQMLKFLQEQYFMKE